MTCAKPTTPHLPHVNLSMWNASDGGYGITATLENPIVIGEVPWCHGEKYISEKEAQSRERVLMEKVSELEKKLSYFERKSIGESWYNSDGTSNVRTDDAAESGGGW